MHEGQLHNVLVEIEAISYDIIGLCATKLKQIFELDFKGNHTLYHSGVAENINRGAGVSILIHVKHKDCVIKFNGKRIALMKIRGKYNNIVILQYYAPTASHSEDTFENVYTVPEDIINNVSKRDFLFVNGDCNLSTP